MALLVPEDDIPVGPDGRRLVGGWFAVDHTRGRLRLIFDRRPQNSTERTLTWPRLPSGCQLQHVVLEPWETIRGSGDDLECWFYNIRHEPDCYHKNAIGRPLTGADFLEVGGISGVNYRMCLKVVAMGDTNGVAIAQEVHESILAASSCFDPAVTVHYDAPFPERKCSSSLT